MTRDELCATCGEDCMQCSDEARVKAKERVQGCTACAGTCVPRMLWVGRKTQCHVHSVGKGAANGERWKFNTHANIWEIGLRANMPQNPKRNRFQWMQGHKVRIPHDEALSSPAAPHASNLAPIDIDALSRSSTDRKRRARRPASVAANVYAGSLDPRAWARKVARSTLHALVSIKEMPSQCTHAHTIGTASR
jgi:hypothetical protein